jgi:hypothetical protein
LFLTGFLIEGFSAGLQSTLDSLASRYQPAKAPKPYPFFPQWLNELTIEISQQLRTILSAKPHQSYGPKAKRALNVAYPLVVGLGIVFAALRLLNGVIENIAVKRFAAPLLTAVFNIYLDTVRAVINFIVPAPNNTYEITMPKSMQPPVDFEANTLAILHRYKTLAPAAKLELNAIEEEILSSQHYSKMGL